MSDANWDIEYSLAYDYLKELKEYCNDKNIKVPEVGDYPRSWELKSMLEQLRATTR